MTAIVFLVVIECVKKWQSIAPLHLYGNPLEELNRLILVVSVIRLPISSINSTARTSHEPAVLMKIG